MTPFLKHRSEVFIINSWSFSMGGIIMLFIIELVIILLVLFCYCACVISSKCSEMEECVNRKEKSKLH